MADDKKIRVLIIEDEPALVDIYSTKLLMEGFEVQSAMDGVVGFEMAVNNSPDCILLDVLLPSKDGFEVLKDLRDIPKMKEVPIIILSNLGQEYEIKRGLSLGATRFLTKANLTPARVVDEVRAVLKKS